MQYRDRQTGKRDMIEAIKSLADGDRLVARTLFERALVDNQERFEILEALR